MLDTEPQLDQQQLNTDGSNLVEDNLVEAQTFVPGIGGELASVVIRVDTLTGVGAATMSIQSITATGEPSGFALGSVTIPAASVPIGSNRTLSFDFSGTPLLLVPGQTYAIVLSVTAATGTGQLRWLRDSNNPYPSGINYQSDDSGATWSEIPETDFVFTTNMVPELRREVLIGAPLMFGNTAPGSIHGFKFEDVDGDGIYNGDLDLPLEGVVFTLTGTDGQGNVVNTMATTDANGEFWFTGLFPSVDGTGPATGYTVSETVPTGFVATTSTSFTTDLFSRQELVAFEGQSMIPLGDPRVEVVVGADLMFGNTVPGSIHGFKFDDVNGNGVYNVEIDLPLAGVAFTLTGIDGQGNLVDLTEVTDESGEFWFTGLLPSIDGAGDPDSGG